MPNPPRKDIVIITEMQSRPEDGACRHGVLKFNRATAAGFLKLRTVFDFLQERAELDLQVYSVEFHHSGVMKWGNSGGFEPEGGAEWQLVAPASRQNIGLISVEVDCEMLTVVKEGIYWTARIRNDDSGHVYELPVLTWEQLEKLMLPVAFDPKVTGRDVFPLAKF